MQDQGYAVPQTEGLAVEMDPVRSTMAADAMHSQQRLGLAVLAAVPVALICSVVWAVATVATGWQIGWMAIGVAFLIGMTVRLVGRGFDPVFGVVGAVLSLASCALGNLLAGCGFVAAEEGVATLDVLMSLNGAFVIALMTAMFSPMDLLFYGLALYEGFKLSINVVDEHE